jgi:hypothetical protein
VKKLQPRETCPASRGAFLWGHRDRAAAGARALFSPHRGIVPRDRRRSALCCQSAHRERHGAADLRATYNAQAGDHDDLVLAVAVALWWATSGGFVEQGGAVSDGLGGSGARWQLLCHSPNFERK